MTLAPPAGMRPTSSRCLGLLLAAGAGSRYGKPKALVDRWLPDRLEALRAGGCDEAMVVLGAEVARAAALVPPWVKVVVAEDWATGLGASLRAGLAAASASAAAAVVVALVDTPGLTAEAVARVVRAGVGSGPEAARHSLAQATYDGVPGHPVLLGRAHWVAVAQFAEGDRGARGYLAGNFVRLVECGDVADGQDVDVDQGSDGDGEC